MALKPYQSRDTRQQYGYFSCLSSYLRYCKAEQTPNYCHESEFLLVVVRAPDPLSSLAEIVENNNARRA